MMSKQSAILPPPLAPPSLENLKRKNAVTKFGAEIIRLPIDYANANLSFVAAGERSIIDALFLVRRVN